MSPSGSKTSKTIEWEATEVNQHGRILYSTAISAKEAHDLIANGLLKVDRWSESNPDGYQREPVSARVKRFAKYAAQADDGVSPAAAILFMRKPDRISVKKQNGRHVTLTAELDPEHPFYIPDGQHRLYGMAKAYENKSESMAQYDLPVVVMVAKDKKDPRYEEAVQFNTINTLQKRVPTDLAQRYLLRRREKNEGTIDFSEPIPSDLKRDELKPYGVALIDALNHTKGGAWENLIALPNTETHRPISQNSFLESILPILQHASEYNWTPQEVQDTIEAFWGSVTEKCGAAGEHWHNDGCDNEGEDDHDTFNLRTTSGVFSLNEVLSWLVGWSKVSNEPTNPDVYNEILDLDPDHFSEAYWDTENEEGAGQFGTSRKAFKDIATDIKQALGPALKTF